MRSTILLTATVGSLVALGAFAPVTAAESKSAFSETCGKCHARPASVVRDLSGSTEEQRRDALDEFLSTHHAEDAQLRGEIVGYLLGLVRK